MIDTVMNDLVVLAMLAEAPKHGYQLKREAGFILGGGDMHNNLVYPLLRRFTADGWVTRRTVPGERGQTRKSYSLTVAGRRELLSRLSSFGEADATNARAFLARVGMFDLLPAETRASILDLRERYLQGRTKRLDGLKNNLELGVFGSEAVRHIVQQTHAELAWIRRLRRLQPDEKKI